MPFVSIIGLALAAQPIEGIAFVPVRSPIAEGPEAQADAVANMVWSISSYTRWPKPPSPMRICVTGATATGDGWIAIERRKRSHATIRRVESGPRFPSGECDIAYVGRLSASETVRTFAAIRGRAVLSVTDADPLCRAGAMFCLDIRADSLSFSLNIDSVSRSTVKVDPRVLRLARPQTVAEAGR